MARDRVMSFSLCPIHTLRIEEGFKSKSATKVKTLVGAFKTIFVTYDERSKRHKLLGVQSLQKRYR